MVYRPDIYLKAAEALFAAGKITREDVPFGTVGFNAITRDFIDGIAFDGRKPNDYLGKFAIGLKGNQTVQGGQVVGG
jgi:nitrate/nitrite transport system substrate-binding protein